MIVYETIGRRVPVVLGFILQTFGLFVIPSSQHVPYFFVGSLLMKAGEISWDCPLIPDIVKEESHGLANSYIMMIISVAESLSICLLRISTSDSNNKIIFYSTGLLSGLITLVIYFGLNDPVKRKNQKRKGNHTKIMVILNESWHLIRHQPIILLSIFGDVCSHMIEILSTTYTTLIVSDAYEEIGRSQDDAKSYLFWILIISNIASFFLSWIYGYADNYVPIINLLLITLVGIFIASYFLISSLDSNLISTFAFSVSSIIISALNNGNFVLTRTMLMQELKENSRGAILSIEGLITFVFLMIYHKLLGFTYDSLSKKFTFIIGFLFLGVYTSF
jgi:hypothetical protein